jgi:hypothetical protein
VTNPGDRAASAGAPSAMKTLTARARLAAIFLGIALAIEFAAIDTASALPTATVYNGIAITQVGDINASEEAIVYYAPSLNVSGRGSSSFL